jgi:hypothetical protein
MPRLLGFDWDYWWYEDVPVRLGWLGTDWAWMIPMNRFAIWCSIGAILVFAAAFAGWGWSQYRGPLNLLDE